MAQSPDDFTVADVPPIPAGSSPTTRGEHLDTSKFPFPVMGTDDLPQVPGYQVLGEIARGGMGRVLLARDLVLDRDVAIKVLLPGVDADRFVREAKITARLPHPGIPPVHALGTLANGSPFLAVKLIAGQTLAEVMAHASLSHLLQVFSQICQAIGFAHSRGVIHRDLKPTNIMVGEFGEVQVIDWGLAKELASQEETTRSAPTQEIPFDSQATVRPDAIGSPDGQTEAGAIMGTPAYMAPEQARGESTDCRTDVFALGGILCAILTGKPAFASGSTTELLMQSAAGDLGDALARLQASGTDTDLVELARRCMAPQADDRPRDARQLADELDAYRARVEARLRRADEQRKRRRMLLLAGGAIMVVLLAGVAASAWQTRRALAAERQAREDRDAKETQRLEADRLRVVAQDQQGKAEQARILAEQEKAVALAVRGFLQGQLLKQANPYERATAAGKAGGDARASVTVRELLDRAARDFGPASIGAKFPGQPLVQAEVLETIGETYEGLGQFNKAIEFVSAALVLREKYQGPDHPVTLTSMVATMFVHMSGGKHVQAVPYILRLMGRIESAVERSIASQAAGTEDTGAIALDAIVRKMEERADPRFYLYPAVRIGLADGAMLILQAGRILPQAKRVASLATKRFGKLDRRSVAADILCGFVHHALGQVRQANVIYEDAISRAEKVLPAGHWGLIGGREGILMTYAALGIKGEKTFRLQTELLQTKLRILGSDHPSTATTLVNLAISQIEANEVYKARVVLERFCEERTKAPVKPGRSMENVLVGLSEHCQATNRKAVAVALLEGFRDWATSKLGPNHLDSLAATQALARTYLVTGKPSEATKMLEMVLKAREKTLGADHPETLLTMHELAGAYRGAARLPEAIKLYEQVHSENMRLRGTGDSETTNTLSELATTYLMARRFDDAVRTFKQVHAVTVKALGPDDPASLLALEEVGRACRDAGRFAEAIKLHEQARTARVKTQGAEHPSTLVTRHNLAFTYAAAGRKADAITLYEQVRAARIKKEGVDSFGTLITLENLALLYLETGQKDRALPVLEQAAGGAEKRNFQSERSVGILSLLIRTHERAGAWEKAAAWRRKWLAHLKKRHPMSPERYVGALEELGMNLLRQKQWTEAEALLREALAVREKSFAGKWMTSNARSLLGAGLLGQGRCAEAEPLLLKGYEGMKERQKKIPSRLKGRLIEAGTRLGQLYKMTGKKEQAAKIEGEIHRLAPTGK